jgi:signal transduction histidine kinase
VSLRRRDGRYASLRRRGAAFLRPVPSGDLVSLSARFARASRLGTGALLLVHLATLLPAIGLGLMAEELTVVWAATTSLALAACFGWSFTPSAARIPEGPLVGSALVVIGLLYSFGVPTGRVELGLPMVAVVPCVFAIWLPWRPTISIALGIVGAAALAAAPELLGPEAAWGGYFFAPLALGLGIAAAIANQIQRRVWLDLEQARGTLIALDRLAQAGRLGAVLAHELKTPMAAARSHLKAIELLLLELERSVGHPEVEDTDLLEAIGEAKVAADSAAEQADRAANYVASLREHTRPNQGRPAAIDLRARVEDVLVLLGPRAGLAGVELRAAPGVEGTVTANPTDFDQVLTNLVRNGVHAIEEAVGSTVEVQVRRRAHSVLIAVQDDGPGVPDELRDAIFEQHFSTKPTEKGMGLGLWICRNIAEASGGRLDLVPRPDGLRGARFEWTLPVDDRARTRGEPKAADSWAPGFGQEPTTSSGSGS